VPTFAQAGLPGFDVELWFGLLAPGGTPRAIVERLNTEVGKIIQSADFKEKVAAQGLEVFISSPEQYGAALRAESEKFGRIVKDAKIEPQ
jgi:tripartite-type tricarboxylate transporter receptor subunit TctC